MRPAIAAVLCAACGAAPSHVAPLRDVDDPWPMFRREPRHTGDASDRAELAWEIAWQVELGERVDASPLVVENGVVVATRKGTVALLDPMTGAQRARASLGGGIWATPTAARGVIVVGVSRDGGGDLVGLDARDLRVRWRREVATTTGRGKGGTSFSAGTADGDRVLLCVNTSLLVVHVDDGRELARRATGQCLGAPGIDEDTIYVATRGGELLALPPELAPNHDGGAVPVRWRVPIGERANNDTAPVLTDELVLVGSNNGSMYAFARADGALRWKVDTGAWVVSAPAIADGKAIFGDDGDRERAVDLSDGTEYWNGRTGGDVASSAVVVGDYVIHGAHDGRVYSWGIGPDVPFRASIDAGAPMFASPAVTREGLVVIATHQGRVVAIR